MKSSTGSGLFFLAAGAALFFLAVKDSFGADDSVSDFSSGGLSNLQKDYIGKYYNMAKQTEQYYAVPAPVTLAQGILESAAGTSNLAVNANNHFGIKADSSWNGPTYNGYRKYSSAGNSFIDHAKFLTMNPRYSAAFDTTDPVAFIQAVAAAGYAGDPLYAQKIIGLFRDMSA